MSFLAKKKLDKILIKANAGTPKPKNFKAEAVKRALSKVKDPYPNKALTISSEAKIKPMLAGIDNKRDNSIDLLCIFEIKEIFFCLKALDKTGSETVPTAIPAKAKLI